MSKKRRHEDHDEHMDESWLVPYADILTLLLALFIVLYSMNTMDTKKFEDLSNAFRIAFNSGAGVMDMPSIIEQGTDLEQLIGGSEDEKEEEKQQENNEITKEQLAEILAQTEEDLSKLKQEIDEYIAANGLSSSLDTSLNMSQLIITIRDHALFNSAEATVNKDGQELAVSIAKMLENYPDYNIVISGHTDNSPINNREFRSNWDLSAMRAVRFMDIMLENSDVSPARFSAVGYGEHHPVASNDTEEGRAQNRRVEVYMYASQAMIDAAEAEAAN